MKKSILGIGIVMSLSLIFVIAVANSYSQSIKVGKNIYIEIDESENIDAEFLKSVIKDDVEHDFNKINKNAINKLIKYMNKENLKIKPNLYIISEIAKYEKLLEILEFEKKESSVKKK
jgi:late competence protein required for DNA uptake (superfamily II DNA/RNA helicase)